MPRGSNWTNGDGYMSWTGARPTGPTNASGHCGSSMAGTKARVRDSHRDRGPPSASPTLRAPRPTKTQPRRSQSRWGASVESQAQRRGRSSRRRATTRGPLQKSGRGRHHPETGVLEERPWQGDGTSHHTPHGPWWRSCQETQDGFLVIGPQG